MTDEATVPDEHFDAVEPNIIRPPLHQFFTRDWRFWAALTGALALIGLVVALFVVIGSNTDIRNSNRELTQQVATLTDSVAVLTDSVGANDDAAKCRSELNAAVNAANVAVTIANGTQDSITSRLFVAAFAQDKDTIADLVTQLDGSVKTLDTATANLNKAVLAQQAGLTSCSA